MDRLIMCMKQLLKYLMCAGWENRTPTYSLENCHSTIKLIPQIFATAQQTCRSKRHTITPFSASQF